MKVTCFSHFFSIVDTEIPNKSKRLNQNLEEVKGTDVSSTSGTRHIRSNVYSQVENTGIKARDALRKRIVKIFRDDLTAKH